MACVQLAGRLEMMQSFHCIVGVFSISPTWDERVFYLFDYPLEKFFALKIF